MHFNYEAAHHQFTSAENELLKNCIQPVGHQAQSATEPDFWATMGQVLRRRQQ